MNTASLSINREPLSECLRQWHGEEEALEADVAESLAALEAYQSHLDGWSRELAAEREALAAERQEWEEAREQPQSDSAELAGLRVELADARDRISQLTADSLAKTDELRTLEKTFAQLSRELSEMNNYEMESDDPPDSQLPAQSEEPTRASGDPVIGSVVAQFDKLRQLRAKGRQPRHRRK